jgi:hypothetical protein
MANILERDYQGEDLIMLQRAQVFHNGFVTDKAAFVADFPLLDDPFITDMQTAINTADVIPSSAEVESEIIVVTEELNAQLPLGQKALQKLYTYVEMAWESKAREKDFGRDRYQKARNSQLKMKELLELAHRKAEKPANKTVLLATGYTQAAIDELETIATTIDTINAQQEDLLAARTQHTEARISAYNTVWGFMKKINQASKVTFADNPAKIDFYLLYPTTTQSLPKVQSLVVVQAGQNACDLSWQPVIGAIAYEVEFALEPNGQPRGQYEPLTTVPTTNTSDALQPGFTHWYRVRAINENQTGAFSDPASISL